MELPLLSINCEVKLYCDVISLDPLIVVGFGSPGPGQPALTLSHALRDKKVYYILWSWWTLQDDTELFNMVTACHYLKKHYPQHDVHVMANDQVDMALLKKCDINSTFCHQNAFLDQRIFNIIDGSAKKYDAIYNARLSPFKRHALASQLNSVGLIYYSPAKEKEEGIAYKNKIKRDLPNAAFLNEHPETGVDRFLSSQEICRLYNMSKVGLCLSYMEGAMYAATEYLLCGIPVVSTHNIGGRDYFLHRDFSRLVDSDPRAVAEATYDLISEKIPPKVIRQRTLLEMLKQRQIFIDHVQSIFDKENVGRTFADEWDVVFKNKLLVWGIPNWQVLEYIREHEGHRGPIPRPLARRYGVTVPEDFVWE